MKTLKQRLIAIAALTCVAMTSFVSCADTSSSSSSSNTAADVASDGDIEIVTNDEGLMIAAPFQVITPEDGKVSFNDIDFNDEMRIFILTGPNRGGKTIFTQAWGLAMLLAQLGIYVPASKAAISPCDNIFTHFPADENDTVDLGRLGEESKRLSEIFKQATERSVMLLNESLATTSVTEGLFIAKDVVKAMRYMGVRCIFNTHMHDLARSVDELNAEIEGKSAAASLVTGVHDGERSFKVSLLPPQGISYAKDIALKYGVSFAQIKESIDSRAEEASAEQTEEA